MAYQTITRTSYGQRLKKSGSNVGTGFLLVIAATILLFWNEDRTVKTTKMLKQAQKECVELGDISQVNGEMNGKMIHASGTAKTEDILTDGVFGLSQNAIKFRREVEYYQWTERTETETHDKVGGGEETITTYYYEKKWVSSPVNSANFEDPEYRNIDNTVVANIEDEYKSASNVSFGAYTLPDGLISQMSSWKDLPVELNPTVTATLNNQVFSVRKVNNADGFVHVSGNDIYLGANSAVPEVGDVRISFEYVPAEGEVSILAKVNGNTFEQFTAKNGKTLLTLTDGTVSMEEMFATERANNKMIAWLLRALGLLLLFIGFKNIFDILVKLLKVLPFLADIASLGTGLVAGALALAWGLVVIAIAWLFYRPLLGILLLAIVGGLIWFLGKKSKEKKAAAAAAAPAPAPAPAPAAPAAPAEPTEPTEPQA
ncbi:MAG: TMEM43 family protein [Bacteroidales bacterium]|nr:TMEM43 family protein [Bacteroidales bacterium]